MSDTLNEAVALLNDLLALSRTTTSVVDQARLDALIEPMAVSALEEVDRFSAQLVADAEAAALAVADAEAEAARNLTVEERAAEQALVQEEQDQAEREERNRLGVS